MNTYKEILWHFTCANCKNWWSIANSDGWQPPEKLWCPHCGIVNLINYE